MGDAEPGGEKKNGKMILIHSFCCRCSIFCSGESMKDFSYLSCGSKYWISSEVLVLTT